MLSSPINSNIGILKSFIVFEKESGKPNGETDVAEEGVKRMRTMCVRGTGVTPTWTLPSEPPRLQCLLHLRPCTLGDIIVNGHKLSHLPP